jgi:hypothetical protein
MELGALTMQVRKLKLHNRVVSTPHARRGRRRSPVTDGALADRIQ